MSAAEKLKALDATCGSPTTSLGSWQWTDVTCLLALRNALPQIVAVVEEAENVESMVGFAQGHPLHAALAALDEALP